MVTTTERPLRWFVTFTLVPNGRLRCAAVSSPVFNFCPLAVPLPLSWEYTEARPLCSAADARVTWMGRDRQAKIKEAKTKIPPFTTPSFHCGTTPPARPLRAADALQFEMGRETGGDAAISLPPRSVPQ